MSPQIARFDDPARPDAADQLVFVLIFIPGDTVGLGTGSALDKLGRPVIEKPISPEELRRVIQSTLAECRNGYYIL
ncbi:MAG: hypothetical protein JOY83_11345 [Alphaproteobacteria bacterium]|nr:hypothetical protein [Alphaproteobacteria bacterium]